MPSTAAAQPVFQTAPDTIVVPPAAKKQPRRITWREFERRYLSREDNYKYEWRHGWVEKTKCTMNPMQLYLQFNLQELFMRLKTTGKVSGQLLPETDLFFFQDVHRRPDFAWLTHQQVNNLTREQAIEIPAFIIEVISTYDAAQKIVDKMRDYRAAGVQVLWLIFPIQQEVHVYSGLHLESMTVCTGEKICSAAPALPEFSFPVSALFQKSAEQDN